MLSHQRINYRFIQVQLSEEISRSTGLIKVNKEDIFNFATPKLLENYINEASFLKIFNELATELIKDTHPGTHNQALMEFGALQCKPRNPDCTICPLNKSCYALLSQKIDSLPVKQKKTQQRDRYFNYLVLNFNNHIWLQKRIKKDIWKNLYEFPVIETKGKAEIENIMRIS